MDEPYSDDAMAGEMPIGKQDFKEIRDKDNLYIDKSDMIPRILSDGAEVYLYTRPRRFGKSLNLSMLDAFFNIKYPKDNKWFDGLKVSECGWCQKHKNAYPVICFDFKNLGSSSYPGFIHKLKNELSDLYAEFKYLMDSHVLDDRDIRKFKSAYDCIIDDYDIGFLLRNLSSMLYRHHGKKVIILLDEYDNPINNSYGKPFHQDVIDVMRDILSSALKGNESLEFGVITGVMQIAKESIFSGLNSLYVNNVLSEDFDESFGFTDEEVRSILEDNGHLEKYQEAKEWYDGYRFGDTHVYNPWSILNYVKSNFKPRPYWAGTSGNSIIQSLLDKATDDTYRNLLSLSQGESLVKSINTTVTFADIDANPDNIYSMMLMSGYLKAVPDGSNYRVSLPNGEMFKVFGEFMASHLDRLYPQNNVLRLTRQIYDAIVGNDVDKLEHHLYELLADSIGSIMLDNERVYQGFITGLLMHLSGRYHVTAEQERGKGRYDILLESMVPGCPHVVIELKRLPSDADEDTAVSESNVALEQIKGRDYVFGLKGNILLYGIAFRGKQPTIVSDMMVRRTLF